ncbi:MAG: methylmalonyl Co-A mutase-associated GTPase MeaB [Acidimicrobiia bacterium]
MRRGVGRVTMMNLLPAHDDAAPADDRRVARMLSEIENRSDLGRGLFSELYLRSGTAATTGVTGAPGAGKSTLVAELVPRLLETDQRLAVVAVDPSSPFTGGAILGDRVRMSSVASDERVFIRSLANRGSLGGISETTPSIVASLDGLGFSEVIVETVGVGQSEVEVAMTANTTVVVVPAGWGDTVQAAKAGFLEIADVLVVNKADRPDADRTVADLVGMIETGPHHAWTVPVVKTIATDGQGVDDLAAAIRSHRSHLAASGEGAERMRVQAARHLAAALRFEMETSNEDDAGIVDEIASRAIDPWTAAVRLSAAQ